MSEAQDFGIKFSCQAGSSSYVFMIEMHVNASEMSVIY